MGLLGRTLIMMVTKIWSNCLAVVQGGMTLMRVNWPLICMNISLSIRMDSWSKRRMISLPLSMRSVGAGIHFGLMWIMTAILICFIAVLPILVDDIRRRYFARPEMAFEILAAGLGSMVFWELITLRRSRILIEMGVQNWLFALVMMRLWRSTAPQRSRLRI